MTTDLAELLTAYRADAAVLKRHGDKRIADAIVSICDGVEGASAEWLTFLNETDAVIRSGRSVRWLRQRFAELEREGNARLVNGQHQYRACMIPRRARVLAAAERGRQAAEELRKSA